MKEKHLFSVREFKGLDTKELRQACLLENLFEKNEIKAVYSYADRMIIGGVYPKESLALKEITPENQSFFLEKREMGIINIGGPGSVSVNGTVYDLETMDGLYIGKGEQEVKFTSKDKDTLAKFYFVSTLSKQSFPVTLIKYNEVTEISLGSKEEANERVLCKYIHPEGVKSSQLVMGFTRMLEGSVWNSLPPHIHKRRTEVYFYFDLQEEDRVFHLMGPKDETRHVVIKNEQAIISPYWSM